jgi:hypothetical protein
LTTEGGQRLADAYGAAGAPDALTIWTGSGDAAHTAVRWLISGR